MDTLFVGRHFIQLESVDSTNKYAFSLIEEKACYEGTLINAFEQFQGKGQRGNNWMANPGENLTMSLILTPTFLNVSQQFYLNKAISLGVADFLAFYTDENIKIKWPNDILISEKKIAGILIENVLRGNSINYSIIGLGININQMNFPDDLTHATSLKMATGFSFVLSVCIDALCLSIERRYLQLKSGNSKIDVDYLNKLFRLNEWCDYEFDGFISKAKITGVSESGKLKMKLLEENSAEFDLKEVKFVY